MRILNNLRETMEVVENNVEYAQAYFMYKIGVAEYKPTKDNIRRFIVKKDNKTYEMRYDQLYNPLCTVVWG